MISSINETDYKKYWLKYSGSPLQSWSWGNFKSSSWKVDRLCYRKRGEILGVVTLMQRKATNLPGLNSIGRFIYIPRGFALSDEKEIENFTQELSEYIKDLKAPFALIDPENNLLIRDWNEKFKNALESNNWVVAGKTIQPNQTDIIEIDEEEGDIYKSVRSKWKRNINKAKRQGVVVKKVLSSKEIEKFYEVIAEVKGRTDFKSHKMEYYKRMWNELRDENLIRIYLAEIKGKTVAAYLILLNKYLGAEVYGGATEEGRRTEASYLLKWEIIKNLSKEGMKRYDQWGVAPKSDKDHPLKGVSYFKSGFGGRYVEFLPQYVLINNRLGYWLYKTYINLRGDV